MTAAGGGSLSVGIALTLATSLLFATHDSLGKQMTLLLPVIQVLWARYTVQTVLMTGYLAATGGRSFLRTRRPVLQVLRSLTLLSASLCVFTSLRHVPVADITAIVYFSPVLITLLSVVFLKEKIGVHRTVAILVGLAGVLLIVQPGLGAPNPWYLLALAAAFLNAVYLMLTRQLAGAEETAATQFNTTATGTLVLSFLVVGNWETPSPGEAGLLVLLGLIASCGHFLLVRAFFYAPASLLSPYLYCQVMFATLFSVFWFGDALRPAMALGAVLLVASGLYIWWRENRLRPAQGSKT